MIAVALLMVIHRIVCSRRDPFKGAQALLHLILTLLTTMILIMHHHFLKYFFNQFNLLRDETNNYKFS